MQKSILVLLIILIVVACKKTKYAPEGPTDVRVKNNSDFAFNEVIVNTSAGIDTLGEINPGEFSEYHRFDKAFPKAEITARINGQFFSNGTINYTGMTYIGQAKLTYTVIILSTVNKTLEISDCSLDAPLD